MKTLLLITLLILFVSYKTYGASPTITVFHVNGVNNTFADALNNVNNLRMVSNINSKVVAWDLLYNSTHGLLTSDLWEVMKMKKQEAKSMTIGDYVFNYMNRFKLDYPEGSPEYKRLEEKAKQIYHDDADEGGKNLPDLINQFKAKVTNLNKETSYILFIPHSQGNQYVNQLWTYLVNKENFQKSHLAVFGIASPTDHMEGTVKPITPNDQVGYYTADNDYIINSLAALLHFIPETTPPMKGNMHLNTCDDKLCHNLVSSYLTDKTSRALISTKISAFITTLKKNMLEEQLGKSINAMMWFDDRFMPIAVLRSGSGQVICGQGKCDENVLQHLETGLSQFDSYKDYRWSSNLESNVYMIMIPQSLYSSSFNYMDYFTIRGNITRSVDYANNNCLFTVRDRLEIDRLSNSPFSGKAMGAVGTNMAGCPVPESMKGDGGSKVILGAFLLM